VALFDVVDRVNVVLFTHHPQIFPHRPQLLDVGFVAAVEPVLVLDLQQYDGSTVHCQIGRKNGHQRGKVLPDLSKVDSIVGSKFDAVDVEEPSREPSEVPLGTDVGSGTDEHIKAIFLSQLQEKCQILVFGSIVEFALCDFMVVPHNVDRKRIEAHAFHSLQPMFPVLHRDAGVMDLARDEFGRQLVWWGGLGVCLGDFDENGRGGYGKY